MCSNIHRMYLCLTEVKQKLTKIDIKPASKI